MLEWVASLPGTHHLVAGNHCPVHPMHGGHARQRDYLRAFASVQTVMQRRIGGRKVLMSHFPVVGDHKERPELDVWRPRPFRGVLLHGHTHSAEKVSRAGETLQIHVGIDAWGMTPVSDAQILELIESN
jgi:calcineurin-like phosphoesterase family protein